MAKIKLQELVSDVSKEAFLEAIKTAKPKYKELSEEELAEKMGLSAFQFNHLVEKALGKSVSEKLEAKFEETLKEGDSIEVPHQLNVYVHQSKTRMNATGEPSRKLSIRTRNAMKTKLN